VIEIISDLFPLTEDWALAGNGAIPAAFYEASGVHHHCVAVASTGDLYSWGHGAGEREIARFKRQTE
jgi:hypothetical protein